MAILALALLAGACQQLPESEITYDAAGTAFSGEQAIALEEAFVTQFPQPEQRHAQRRTRHPVA